MRNSGWFVSALVSAVLFSFNSFASEAAFFKGIQGKWSGPGEIVAGKYKGTKFVCTFGGQKPEINDGMAIDGDCRVGVFSRPMKAEILKTAGRYLGAFLDGADGEGMDVTGGRYTHNRLVVEINRKELKGIMVANLDDPNNLKVTISVRHPKGLIPVIGMNLKRKGNAIITGSIN